MMSPACPLPMNSSARSRHWLAPGAVRNAGSEPDGFSFGRSAACSGPMRLDGPGSRRSSVAERTTIGRLPSLAGSTNAPTHVAPASSRTVSPGRARSSAACRSSPARTVMVAPATGVLQRTSNVPMKIAATARWPRRRVALCILLTSAVWRSVPHRNLLPCIIRTGSTRLTAVVEPIRFLFLSIDVLLNADCRVTPRAARRARSRSIGGTAEKNAEIGQFHKRHRACSDSFVVPDL